MKISKLFPAILLSALPLAAGNLIYEGFNPEDEASGVRTGFMTFWHNLQGEVSTAPESIPMPGFSHSNGSLVLSKKGEALAQVGVETSGTYYGSFRVRSADLKRDSVICLVFGKPDLDELTPKTANISFIVKGWRNDYAAIVSQGKNIKGAAGVPIQAKEAYLVVFKVQDGSSGTRLIESWILNTAQAQHFSQASFTEAELNAAPLGEEAGAVMQRLSLEPKPSARLSLARSDVLACMAKFNPKTVFDEIRISTSSLREATGALSK